MNRLSGPTIAGQFFHAAVSPTGKPMKEAAEPERTELADPILESLCRLDSNDPAIQHKISVLIGKRIAENKTALELIEQGAEKERALLTEKWELVKKQARDQQRKINELRKEIADTTRQWNAAVKVTSDASMKALEAEAKRKTLSRFAPSSAIQKAEEVVDRADEAFAKAEEAESRWLSHRNQLVLVELPKLQKELERLATEEIRLRARVTGESFTDPSWES